MATPLRKNELTDFLLGRLAGPDRERLEAALFASPDAAALDEMEEAENDLLDEYAAGRLAAADRAQFERFYLTTPERVRRVQFARALAAESRRQAAEAKSHAAAPRWWQTLLLPGPRFALAGAGLALAAALTGFLVVNRQLARTEDELLALSYTLNEERARFARELAAARQTQAVPQAATQAVGRVVTFVLSAAGLSRGGGGEETAAAPLRLAATVETVRLQLPVDAAARGRYARFTAVVETAEGRVVWRSAQMAAAGTSVTVALPAASLAGGDYLVRLSGVAGAAGADAESVADFVMRVAR
ncbi:MAG: hypothetical protein IT162_17030 [Bryobacterales bacterium]|nr:hypothetical protein [Bryobacterales bacterium]